MSTENQVTVVTLNGERRSFPPQTTLLDVVRALNLEPERVAIELNRAIVKREMWPGTTIGGGAEIEIVMSPVWQFVPRKAVAGSQKP